MSDSQTLTRTKIKEDVPNDYKVVFHNDSATPFLFVVSVLVDLFNKDVADAETLAYEIHNSGRGIAGSYMYEIAEHKQFETMTLAAEYGFPLIVTLEPMG